MNLLPEEYGQWWDAATHRVDVHADAPVRIDATRQPDDRYQVCSTS